MAANLPFEKKTLHCPPLAEVAKVLSKSLTKNFSTVEVSVVDCPDLTKQPFTLASQGICGSPKLLDVGGPPYLLPLVQRNKVYDIKDFCKIVGLESCLTIGAGAGPWPHIGVNCEGIYNMTIKNGTVDNQTRIAKVIPSTGGSIQETLPNTETRCALLANLLCSEGKPGKVLQVYCKTRTGPENFVSSIRNALVEFYGDKIVGLGGTFLLKEGKAKQHVMPDFPTTSVTTDAEVNQWLKFYEMSAPLIAVGTLVSGDYDLDLRVIHFHSFSHHGEGGHYHYDTTPDTVEYLGYFTVAESIYRIDRPTVTHQVGRD
ncbi:uncharacterized protein CBL_00193 [Carabus blaptoides fortunei]